MLPSYLKLTLAALIPAVATAVLFRLDRSGRFGAVSYAKKQTLYGLIFGAIAILGTEWGIPLENAVVNCRDAAPLCAGLFFGAPAGVIAGCIGALERWLAVYWGAGAYTRLACTVATLLAGLTAAGLKKHIFVSGRPRLFLAAATAFLVEALHQSMVFFLHVDDAVNAAMVVRVTAVPMLIANTASVLLSGVVYAFLDGSLKADKKEQVTLSLAIERQLVILVVISFFFTTAFSHKLQTTVAERQTEKTLLETAESLIPEGGSASSGTLDTLVRREGFGSDGILLILDGEGNLLASSRGKAPAELAELPAKTDDGFNCTLYGEQYFALRHDAAPYQVIAAVPAVEMLTARNVSALATTFAQMFIYGLLFVGITVLLRKTVVNSLKDVNVSLGRIASGDLENKVEQRGTREFSELSDDINATVDTLKSYIAEAKARNEQEMQVARNIQLSALPRTFPAFPQRADMDIYALTQPAREVGGDFYDFYFAGNGKLYLLVADVSGKGIPAAMFMMRAKTQLKGIIESGGSLEEAFFRGNSALCEGNDAEMFVTAWMAEIDMQTGECSFVNAGHNPPLVSGEDGTFEYLRTKPGFVLAGMEGMRYKKQTLQLKKGGRIVLYTDGVTEATNAANELFGEERLKALVNANAALGARELGEKIRNEAIAFTGEAEQFDDITVLVFDHFGTPAELHFDNAGTGDIPAATDFLEKELRRLGCPEKAVSQMDIALDEVFCNIVSYAYTEGERPVTLRLTEKQAPRGAEITFIDEGILYDPLLKEDPDVTLSAEERVPGGLGIFLAKKLTDGARYERRGRQNILTLFKHF